MKLIPLSKNGKNKGLYFAQVDDEDFEYINQFNWSVKMGKSVFYCHSLVFKERTTLHRFILGLKAGDKIIVDHKDHDGLNNQKYNLRKCTLSENARNKTAKKSGTSKYLGVVFNKYKGKWEATIKINGKNKCLGTFNIEMDAAEEYDKNATIYYKEFANLNFK